MKVDEVLENVISFNTFWLLDLVFHYSINIDILNEAIIHSDKKKGS